MKTNKKVLLSTDLSHIPEHPAFASLQYPTGTFTDWFIVLQGEAIELQSVHWQHDPAVPYTERRQPRLLQIWFSPMP